MTQTQMATRRLGSWLRRWTRQLPDKPYPSDHPWRDRHDPERPRG
jgi:hypothetical protein